MDNTSFTPPHNALIIRRLDALWHKRTGNILIQLFRYVFVGGAAFVVDFGLLALFTELFGLAYQLSACLSFIGGLAVNYILSIIWVFDSEAQSRSERLVEFVSFALIGVVGLGMNALIMWFFTEVTGLHYLLSKAISTILVFFWNFLARRSLITYLPIATWKTRLAKAVQ